MIQNRRDLPMAIPSRTLRRLTDRSEDPFIPRLCARGTTSAITCTAERIQLRHRRAVKVGGVSRPRDRFERHLSTPRTIGPISVATISTS